MKRSVGLVVMVRMPDQSASVGHRVMACLQRRGSFNHEKMAPENFPGCLQVTCHGKLEDREDFYDALVRELREELGGNFAEDYVLGYHGQVLIETKTADKEVITFGTLVPIDFIRDLVRLDPDTGGLVYLSALQVDSLVTITDSMKQLGPNGLLAMFPDEIEAVKKGFEIFGKM